MTEREPIILDIRSRAERDNIYIRNSVWIPTNLPPLNSEDVCYLSYNLEMILKYVPKDYPIEVYCKLGKRASLAERILTLMGYTNVVVYKIEFDL